MHAKDDDGTSQWAVLLDPNGAAFGIIPVVSAEAIPPTEGVASRDAAARAGCISWLDLTVSDASATRDFYRQVVGWSVQDVEMEDVSERYADYNMFGDDGKPGGGSLSCARREPGSAAYLDDLPSGWRPRRESPLRRRGRRQGHQGDTGEGWGVRVCGCSGSGGGVLGVGGRIMKGERPDKALHLTARFARRR
jgi:catechol 2,3-dioxygenase-like lactoylglutathione lyase family enzyme